MDTLLSGQAEELLKKADQLLQTLRAKNNSSNIASLRVPEDFRSEFFRFIDKINLRLMEDKDNFYGYFLFQLQRQLRFDLASPTAVNFREAGYVIYFNPVIFLRLSIGQMECAIKHEILHVLSLHPIRAKELKGHYSTLAINMAMDLVVNKYLEELPDYAITLEAVNLNYALALEPYAPLEYYAEKLQAAMDLQGEVSGPEKGSDKQEVPDPHFDAVRTHDIWEEALDIEKETLQEFAEKAARLSLRGEVPTYLNNLIASLKSSTSELPWNLYLKQLMGTVESDKRKTATRRNRRQPDRPELMGELRSHKANILIAIDISGSIDENEFKQALQEVLGIVKNYSHEITIVECDNEIRREYKAKSIKDLKDRIHIKGGTRFTPVFEYANQKKFHLLVYFTDGKGEDRLKVRPRGYRVLWVISGSGDRLSLKEPYGAVKKLKLLETKVDTIELSDIKNSGYSMNSQERII